MLQNHKTRISRPVLLLHPNMSIPSSTYLHTVKNQPSLLISLNLPTFKAPHLSSDLCNTLVDLLDCLLPVTKDFCSSEVFDVSCPKDEVLIIHKALYGRMQSGRCISGEYGHSMGCSDDVLVYMDSQCSGMLLIYYGYIYCYRQFLL